MLRGVPLISKDNLFQVFALRTERYCSLPMASFHPWSKDISSGMAQVHIDVKRNDLKDSYQGARHNSALNAIVAVLLFVTLVTVGQFNFLNKLAAHTL